MFIDRILARFKIQTKVLVFILPFVLSICAVGFTGLYASGLLQGRMEISNSVLQSLSGFKDVYAGMNRFLQNTSEESRDAVHQRLTAQDAVLQTTMDGLSPDADKSKLMDAQAQTKDIVDHSRAENNHRVRIHALAFVCGANHEKSAHEEDADRNGVANSD